MNEVQLELFDLEVIIGGVVVSDLQTALGKPYRVLAEQCREMAKHAVRPAVLLMRAQAFEASAAALEHPEATDGRGGDG
jgi:hypothetical protein